MRVKHKNKLEFSDYLSQLGVSRRFQPAIYIVVHEEFEYEVQTIQILQGNPKKSISCFKQLLWFNPIRGINGDPLCLDFLCLDPLRADPVWFLYVWRLSVWTVSLCPLFGPVPRGLVHCGGSANASGGPGGFQGKTG